MKEQKTPQNLTSRPQSPHTKSEGIFMDQGQNEQLPAPAESKSSSKPTSKEVLPISPFVKPADQILDPELRQYATQFETKIGKKPLGNWTKEELKREYLKLHKLTSDVESKAPTMTGKEQASAETQPYRNLISEELERKGADLKELFLEAIKYAGETGKTKSVGAASADMPLTLDDPILQNIETEVRNVIQDVTGEGNPLDIEFVRGQMVRLRDLLDRGQITNVAEGNRLLGILNRFMAESMVGARTPTREEEEVIGRVVDQIENLPVDSNDRRDKIIELLRYFSPHERTLPRLVINYALEFDETLDSLVNRIVSAPLDAETSGYELSFQGGINLAEIKDILKQESERIDLPHNIRAKREKQYRRVILAYESLTFLHNMNTHIVTGNLEQFIGIAQGITPDHFMHFRDTLGVSQVMRLYEEKYREFLSVYGRISSPVFEQLNDEVRRSFYSFNENGLLRRRKLEEWEIRRALNVGRKFFNITFRSSELIATGKVPRDIKNPPKTLEELEKIFSDPVGAERFRKELEEGEAAGRERFSSYPLETATRLMNWYMYMTYRFIIAEPRGGMKFLEMVGNRYFESLKATGIKLGANKIIELGGINVREMELGGMFGVTGIHSSWRIENQALPSTHITINGESMSIRDWFVRHKEETFRESLRFKDASKKNNRARKSEAQIALADILQPLIDNAGVGLGILLTQEVFKGEQGYEARKRLWKKVVLGNDEAKVNPREGNLPLIINYLTNLKISDNSVLSLSEIKTADKAANGADWDIRLEDEDNPGQLLPSRLDRLREKILLQHELNIKRAAGFDMEGVSDQGFSIDEERLIQSMKNEGLKLVPHLADIAFPYMPFMNDAPFEIFDYNVSGAEFYKRRTGGDLPDFFKAMNSFVAIMNNPGGIGAQKGLEQFYAIVAGIQSPNGTEDAQNKVFPMFEAWIDWVMTKPWQRQAFLKAMLHFMRKPTSFAQEYSSTSADSLDEHQTLDLLEKSVQAGVLNHELFEKMRRKKHLTLLWVLLALFRDLSGVGILSGSREFGKETTKGSQQ